MRTRWFLGVLVAVTMLAPVSARADWWSSFWHRAHVDYHRNNCWPEPFVHADRQAARAPFEIMKHNGWRLQNTLGDQLFHPETHELTRAGALKVQWVVTQSPPHRRTVYVLRTLDPEATHRRVDAVQQVVARSLPGGPLPPVVVTTKQPLAGSGDYFDQIDRRMRASIPVPRLPSSGDAGGGSTGG